MSPLFVSFGAPTAQQIPCGRFFFVSPRLTIEYRLIYQGGLPEAMDGQSERDWRKAVPSLGSGRAHSRGPFGERAQGNLCPERDFSALVRGEKRIYQRVVSGYGTQSRSQEARGQMARVVCLRGKGRQTKEFDPQGAGEYRLGLLLQTKPSRVRQSMSVQCWGPFHDDPVVSLRMLDQV